MTFLIRSTLTASPSAIAASLALQAACKIPIGTSPAMIQNKYYLIKDELKTIYKRKKRN